MRSRLLVASASAFLLAGCAGARSDVTPSATVTTAMPGFTDQWFKIDFTVRSHGAERRLAGYVYNSYRPVGDVKMLAQALDASNQVVGQRIVWVPLGIPTGRSSFEVRHLPPADHYRVTLWSYNVIRK